ncbi:MAG: NAD(P)/FAD-dependent oxidoreductase [Thermoplasmatales archaeon]|nr:NAD(P)/FAD-dependent oxidoreductase [Thermoplasmatales archaeon]
MLEYDVAIVGGGPIGGHIASEIARKKFKVAVFEKNKEIGMPVNCAGLVTPRVFDFLDIPKDSVVQNEIKGANIHSPSGNVITIGGDKVHALVINRSKFDKEIINEAEKKGADIFVNNGVLSAQRIENYVELKTSQKQDIKCKLLIGSDGPHSKIRDRFALPEPKEFLRGIGAEITNTNLDPNFVEIFVGKNIAPGFFAWIIPTNKKGTEARAGLCISQKTIHSPKQYFSNFLKSKYTHSFFEKIEITKYIAGIVPLGVLKKTFDSNVLVVGDAAAQVKPTSGGGIYVGLLCANRCSSVSIEALQKGDYASGFLKKYQKLWSDDIGRELYLGMKFRKIYKSLSDKQFDKYIEKFRNPKISAVITKHGDIDYPSKLIKPLLKKTPSLLKLVPGAIIE